MEMAMATFHTAMLEQGRLTERIRAAKAGDTAAFEQLVALHEQQVLRFARRMLLEREAARDAAQEVFLRLYRHLRSIDERQELTPWLYRTTSNICLDALRQRRHVSVEEGVEPEDGGLDPEAMTGLAEERRWLRAGLATLTARERQAIVLRDLEGYSTAEVARLLGTREATVRSQISTGRVKLREFLEARRGGGKR